MQKTMSELRKGRDKLKLNVKRKRRIFQDMKKAQKEARQKHGRSERRLRAEIEEDISMDIDSSAYHGGALAGNAIRRLMEHAEDVAMGVKLKLLACNFEDRKQEVEDFTSGVRVVLLLLDAKYSLLLTKYGKVTAEILDKLAGLLELLRVQWV
jgi:ribosome-binding protein aMBF1 (putative translation factor)